MRGSPIMFLLRFYCNKRMLLLLVITYVLYMKIIYNTQMPGRDFNLIGIYYFRKIKRVKVNCSLN